MTLNPLSWVILYPLIWLIQFISAIYVFSFPHKHLIRAVELETFNFPRSNDTNTTAATPTQCTEPDKSLLAIAREISFVIKIYIA